MGAMFRYLWLALFISACPLAIVQDISARELEPATIEGLDRYLALTDARMVRELRDGTKFLWPDQLPGDRQKELYKRLRRGEVLIEPLKTLEGDKEIRVPRGLVHHWVGLVFIPDTTLGQTISLVTDYDDFWKFYKPDIIRSKALTRNGNDADIYLRIYIKKQMAAVINTEHKVQLFPMDATRARSRTYTTHVAEVENPDRADEREKPLGKDRGFLWQLNSYWRFLEKDEGVYVQIESISLSRDAGSAFGWLINTIVRSAHKQFLYDMVSNTRAALLLRSTGRPFN
jgi:hypothetical protein